MWFPSNAEVGKLYVLYFQNKDIESTRYYTFTSTGARKPTIWLARAGAVGLVVKQTKFYAYVLVDECIIRLDHENYYPMVVLSLLEGDSFHPIQDECSNNSGT